MGDITTRRGNMKGMDSRGNVQILNAEVPLSEMFGYVTDLRTISSGRATSTMEFFSFVTAPKNIAESVILETTGVQQ